MAEESKRVLHRGPLGAPSHPAIQTSYTEPTSTPGDLLIEKNASPKNMKGNSCIAVKILLFGVSELTLERKSLHSPPRRLPNPS